MRKLKRKHEAVEKKDNAQQLQHSVLKTAGTLVKEAEQKLAAAMRSKDMDQVAVAHAMFETASTKMQEANEKLKEISIQRQELMSEKKNDTVPLQSSSKKARTENSSK